MLENLPDVGGDKDTWGTLLNDALNGLDAGKIGKGELVVNVRDHGAVGDGVTDDLPAFNAAMTASNGGTVLVPSGTYGIGGTLSPQAGVTIQGQGRPTLKAVGGSRVYLVGAYADDSMITGVTLDMAGLTTTAAWITTATKTSIMHCRVIDTNFGAVNGIQVSPGAVDVLIEDNEIDGVRTSIAANYSHTGTTIRDNRISNWQQRGIYVIGDATRSSTDLLIEGNRVTDMAAGGTVRYPIQVAGNVAMPHNRPRIKGNVVVGPGTAYTDAVVPGTADNIAVFHVADFIVSGNTSTDGGDGGITVSAESSRGVIFGNVCTRNNATGIYVGADTDTYNRSIAITGNSLMNNGQDRDGIILPRSRVGIRLWEAEGITVSGNVFGDDQDTKTQQYGVSMTGCDNVKLGPDTDAGNALGLYHLDGAANTNITEVSMTAVV